MSKMTAQDFINRVEDLCPEIDEDMKYSVISLLSMTNTDREELKERVEIAVSKYMEKMISDARALETQQLQHIRKVVVDCKSMEHFPPPHIVLAPGTYEHTCPECRASIQFRVLSDSIR